MWGGFFPFSQFPVKYFEGDKDKLRLNLFDQ